MSTAAEKIRLTLTGSPSGEPSFQHEGAKVTRWITVVRCPICTSHFISMGAKSRCDAQPVIPYSETFLHPLGKTRRKG